MTDPNFLYKVAKAYYEDERTQQEISSLYSISRIKVSRMLQEARNEGIVEITLRPPSPEQTDLEAGLARKLGLREVILAPTESKSKEAVHTAIGAAGAKYFERAVRGGETITLTWGNSLFSFIHQIHGPSLSDVKVVQMLGGLGSPEAEIHGSDLVRKLATRIGATGRILSAPGIVAGKEIQQGLLRDPHVSETLNRAKSADIAFVGIGIAAPDSVLIREGAILSAGEAERLKAQGAVGDIGLRFFNEMGELVEDPINERVVGLTLEEIKNIPLVIGIAGGREKRTAISAAVRGNLVDVLITDLDTGRWLDRIL